MSDAWASFAPAFALGFALGAAPGPVQVLILAETARRGFAGGVRVMLGANLTLLAILVVLALGFSAAEPSETFLRILRVVGGGFLVWIAVTELRALRRQTPVEAPDATVRRPGATTLGVVSVLLNPGAWIFFATTASAVVADASAEAGLDAALTAALAMAVGVSASDFIFTLLGSGGRRVFGERGLRAIRVGLALLLAAIGVAFVVQGATGA
jgi:threonine/homoserine/homoserine lactone efflux protein